MPEYKCQFNSLLDFKVIFHVKVNNTKNIPHTHTKQPRELGRMKYRSRSQHRGGAVAPMLPVVFSIICLLSLDGPMVGFRAQLRNCMVMDGCGACLWSQHLEGRGISISLGSGPAWPRVLSKTARALIQRNPVAKN